MLELTLSHGSIATMGSAAVTPTALAASDFKSGVYSIGGVSKTLAEMWVENLVWGPFNPATHVVENVGLSRSVSEGNSGPVATPALWAVLDIINGFNIVLKTKLIRSADRVPQAYMSIFDLPAYGNETDFVHEANVAEFRRFTPPSNSIDAAPAFSVTNTFAVNFAPGACAFSMNGEAVIGFDDPPAFTGVTDFALWVNADSGAGSGTATATIEELTFYPLQDEADLPALSA